MAKPYYQDSHVTIYHGDCREILPGLAPVDCVITDPVWPNAVACLAGSQDPAGLFADAAQFFPRLAKRVVVQLGCDSDPRFLVGMPPEMPLLRVCWLEYAFPNCKGRILNGGDVAYAFGEPPIARPGRAVIPGRCVSGRVDFKANGRTKWKNKNTTPRAVNEIHPCPRRLEHVNWLVHWFADATVLDPFSGLGTTLLAAKSNGFQTIGIEISEAYCERAANRLAQGVFDFPEAP